MSDKSAQNDLILPGLNHILRHMLLANLGSNSNATFKEHLLAVLEELILTSLSAGWRGNHLHFPLAKMHLQCRVAMARNFSGSAFCAAVKSWAADFQAVKPLKHMGNLYVGWGFMSTNHLGGGPR